MNSSQIIYIEAECFYLALYLTANLADSNLSINVHYDKQTRWKFPQNSTTGWNCAACVDREKEYGPQYICPMKCK